MPKTTKTRVKTSVTENAQSDDARSEIAKIISDVGAWKQPPFSSEEEFAERCGLFKNLVAAKGDSLPTIEAFAMFLGTSYHTLRKWSKGEDCPESRKLKVQEVITWACAIWTEAMLKKVTHPTPYIWYSKQWFDMREPDSKVMLDMVSPLKELPAASSLAQKYLADLGESEKGKVEAMKNPQLK